MCFDMSRAPATAIIGHDPVSLISSQVSGTYLSLCWPDIVTPVPGGIHVPHLGVTRSTCQLIRTV